MIESIDNLVRLIAIGASLMLIAQLVAGEVRSAIKLPAVAMIVGVIGYLINASPVLSPPGPMDPWVDLVSISAPFSIWLFARNLFEREPERRIMLGAAAALLAGWFIGNFFEALDPLGFFVLHIVGLALIADLVRVGLFERKDDLVEQRRVVRLWLPLLVAAQAAGILTYEMFEAVTGGHDRTSPMHFVNASLILLLTLFAGLALLQTDPELLIQTEEDAPDKVPAPLDLSPSETVLHDKLTAAMAEGAWSEPGLTIAALAAELDTPEHRLRALINRRLGYRNFSAFLNRYRIAEARERLADPDRVDLPVLSIAMDLGYNSLPPFNRAFRAETGTTPSEFRRQSFDGAGAARD
ncbi:MAG: helix-turn-helix domain-containing protein [Erythrobacter sp.]